MGIRIDGKNYPVSELKDTDLDAVRIFCNKNKVRAAVITYYDQDGELESVVFYKSEKASRKLMHKVHVMHNNKPGI